VVASSSFRGLRPFLRPFGSRVTSASAESLVESSRLFRSRGSASESFGSRVTSFGSRVESSSPRRPPRRLPPPRLRRSSRSSSGASVVASSSFRDLRPLLRPFGSRVTSASLDSRVESSRLFRSRGSAVESSVLSSSRDPPLRRLRRGGTSEGASVAASSVTSVLSSSHGWRVESPSRLFGPLLSRETSPSRCESKPSITAEIASFCSTNLRSKPKEQDKEEVESPDKIATSSASGVS